MNKNKEKKEIIISNNTTIKFPDNTDKNTGNMLIVGNFNGICSKVRKNENGKFEFGIFEHGGDEYGDEYSATLTMNMKCIIDTIKGGGKIFIISSTETGEYFQNVIRACINHNFFGVCDRKRLMQIYNSIRFKDTTKIYEDTEIIYSKDSTEYDKNIAKKNLAKIVKEKVFKDIEKMKFDTIIQNPPYNGSLHLDFLEKGIDILSDNGKMVIVEPATWLINVRKNGKAKRYNKIKSRLVGHIESVIIENLNKEFETCLFVPFATTTIDMSKTFDTIKFKCCGDEKEVKSIYDCNLIGDYEMIWSILDKVHSFGDMMKNHITKEKVDGDWWYAKYAEILGGIGGALCASTTDRLGGNYDGESIWSESKNGKYCTSYISCAFHFYKNEISNTPLCSYDRGKHLTDKIAENIYGKKEELENWKHFIFNNTLPLFINIVMILDQHNNSKEHLPWVVDKQYTDAEIYDKFKFSPEEIKFIETTIKKFERNSPWFKRYMCGKKSVSDEDVQNYINEINK